MISQGPDGLVVRVGQAKGAGLGLEGLVGLRSATGLSCVSVGTCTVTCLLGSLKQNSRTGPWPVPENPGGNRRSSVGTAGASVPAAFGLSGAMGTGCVMLWEVMGPRQTQ